MDLAQFESQPTFTGTVGLKPTSDFSVGSALCRVGQGGTAAGLITRTTEDMAFTLDLLTLDQPRENGDFLEIVKNVKNLEELRTTAKTAFLPSFAYSNVDPEVSRVVSLS
eukprot:TRINITY_DN14417_c0_g1_i1.p1 TRINITY_DN14417_c0_g1~~TRINITY_DN14417_c0_g1_i1.p1  ORF type:complete len:110 (-),score=13.54 TRINITY_DN14417_c0_g1_i1:17-346(-)